MSKKSDNPVGPSSRASAPASKTAEARARSFRPGENPGEDLAATVARLWKEVLSLPRVGLDDNFFESGGTSLLATVLISKINRTVFRQTDQAQLPIAAIFEYPTLRTMTSLVQREGQAASHIASSGTAAVFAAPANPSQPLPTSAI